MLFFVEKKNKKKKHFPQHNQNISKRCFSEFCYQGQHPEGSHFSNKEPEPTPNNKPNEISQEELEKEAEKKKLEKQKWIEEYERIEREKEKNELELKSRKVNNLPEHLSAPDFGDLPNPCSLKSPVKVVPASSSTFKILFFEI